MDYAARYPSLTKCFLDAIDQRPNPRAQMYRTLEGKWEAYSSVEMLRRVAGLAKAFAALGVEAGDRVGIFAPNSPEWHVADFAALGLGAVDVPIYYNESPDRLTYIWNDAGARVALVSGVEQARKLAACRAKLPKLETVIAVNAPEELRKEFLDYATLIYTSGTTGEPKGVMLSHSNLASNCIDAVASISYSRDDVELSFLPLSHVYERIFDCTALFHGVRIAYLSKIEDVPKALLEVHPTIAAGVPRVFEKTYANILEKGRQERGVKRKLFEWALRVAAEAVPWKAQGCAASAALKWKWNVANRIVYSKIRDGIGGRMRIFYSGGAPLAKELAEFFWAVGVPIYQGYGLTESSPVISTNTPTANKVGTVGRPISNCEVKIAEDGEIVVRGPNVMQGYYNKAEATREAISADGWLRTGDIGHLDADGYLVITDRKKELLKTAAGKFVAPAPIEIRLRTSPFIANAMIVGDTKKFVAALIVPNRTAILSKARAEGVAVDEATLCGNAWVHELIGAEMERLCADLAQYERPKRFALLEKDFTVEGGELTHAMKLKRRVVLQKCAGAIAQIYADVEEPKPQASS